MTKKPHSLDWNNRAVELESDRTAVRKIWTFGLCAIGVIMSILIFALIGGPGCAKVCKPGTMHCLGSKSELCAPNGKWKTVMDCATVKPADKGWRCCCAGDKEGRCSCQPGGAR